MNSGDVELELLNQYLDQLNQASTAEEISRGLALYEKQIAVCRESGINFNAVWHESAVHWFRALCELRSQGRFFERTSRDAARQSTDLGSTLVLAGLANTQEKRRIRKAISHLDKAIALTDDLDSRFLRAECYMLLKEKADALKDAEYIIDNYRNDPEIYLRARKLKDEIDTQKDKGCFVATAVYASPHHPKVAILRRYRDTELMRRPLGRLFVRVYYAVSPRLSDWLVGHPKAKSLVRTHFLDPIVERVDQKMNRSDDVG